MLAAAPFIVSQVMLSSESNVFGVVLKGVDPEREGKVTELANNLKAGRLQDLKEAQAGEPPGIILGVELAKHLSASPGDIHPGDLSSGHDDAHGNDAQDEALSGGGIFHSGMYEFDNTLAYVSIESAQKFFNMGFQVTGIEVKTATSTR